MAFINRFTLYIAVSFMFLFGTFTRVAVVFAHSPHDVIDCLRLSPSYNIDKTIFIAISDHLRRSEDGGFSWKELVNGLDNKYKFTSIAISPAFQFDRTIYVASNGDGIYQSNDGGESWEKVNTGLKNLKMGVLAISPEPFEHTVLAAGSEKGLYLSTNAGESWRQVITHKKITALTFIPQTKGKQILAGDSVGNIYLSDDSGRTWRVISENSNWGAVNCFAVSPGMAADKTLFVGTEEMGVFKTLDNGVSFLPANNGLPNEANIRSLATSPDFMKDKTIFASTWYQAIYCSTDAGDSWVKYTTGVSTDKQADTKKYRSPHFKDFRISNNFAKDKTIFLGGFDGLFKSTNAGQNWDQMETLPIRLIKGMAFSSRGDNHLSVVITTYGGGAYLTENHGKSWTICNNGILKTRFSDIVFSPTYSSDSIIFSASQGNLLKSTDRCNCWNKISLSTKSWQKTLNLFLKRIRISKSIRKKIFPRAVEGVPYPSVLVISPVFDSDQTIFFGTRWHGIYKSVDGGHTNSLVFDSMGAPVMSMAISPDFLSDATLFASVRNKGIFKTTDGGNSWVTVNIGLNFLDRWQLSNNQVQDSNRDILLKISPNYRKDKTVYAACSEGLYKTTDSGKKWRIIENDLFGEKSSIYSITLSSDYEKDQTLFVSIKGRGLFKSKDGGKTFIKLAPQLINENHILRWIEFSKFYSKDKTIYAASNEELFRSTDRGRTWQIVKRPVRYENHRDVLKYDGPWEIIENKNYSATRLSYSNTANAKMILFFVGSGIDWIGSTANDQGVAKIYIDDKHMANVDQYSKNREFKKNIYSIRGLTFGPHKITIEVSGMKNPASAGYRIEVDALDVLP